jgi:hypothetical protein
MEQNNQTHQSGVNSDLVSKESSFLDSTILIQKDSDISNLKLQKNTNWVILFTVLLYSALLTFIPAWSDKGDFGSSSGILFLGWLGLLIGMVSWYWFIPTIFFLRSIFTEGYFTWGPLRKIFLVIFYVLCLIPLVFFIQVGEIAPGDIDCQCQVITSLDGGYYLYLLLIVYLLSLIFFFHVLNRNSIFFKLISYLFMIFAICIFTYFKIN